MKTLYGLTNSPLKSDGLVRLLTSILIEDIITKSLKKSIAHNIYSAYEKKRLYSFLKDNLLLKEVVFHAALDDDRFETYKLCLGRESESDMVLLNLCQQLDQKLKKFNEKTYQLSNEKEKEKLFSDFDIARKNFIKNNQKRLEEIDDKDQKTLHKEDRDIIIESLFYFVNNMVAGDSKIEFMKRVEENKELLKNW